MPAIEFNSFIVLDLQNLFKRNSSSFQFSKRHKVVFLFVVSCDEIVRVRIGQVFNAVLLVDLTEFILHFISVLSFVTREVNRRSRRDSLIHMF